ncbi:ATP-binding protein [Acinetobacter sp. ACNIH2]|nr:ATP-binding protein [Acinetobacter sp. ACNIH2]
MIGFMDSLLKEKVVIDEYSKSIFDINAFKDAVFLNKKEIKQIDSLSADENFEINNMNSRFFRITELSAQEQFILRQDLENVIASMNNVHFNWVYYLSGTETGIEIYIGTVLLLDQGDVFNQKKLLESQLLGNISGILLEDVSSKNLQDHILSPLNNSQHFGLLTGVPSLTIDQQAQSKGSNINQGIDRLARSLTGETWQLLLVAQPAKLHEINQTIEEFLNLSSDLHPGIKKSIQSGTNTGTSLTEGSSTSISHGLTDQTGSNKSRTKQHGLNDSITNQTSESGGESSSNSKNNSSTSTSDSKNKGWTKGESKTNGTSSGTSDSSGTSESKSVSKSDTKGSSNSSSRSEGKNTTESREFIDKKIERIEKYITEKQLPRFELGRSKGLFKTAIYLSAYNKRTYESLVLAVRSTFQGNQSVFSPLQVQKLHMKKKDINQLFKIHWEKNDINKDALLLQSTPSAARHVALATWLNASELSILAGLPSREVCGIRLRKNVDFAVNPLNSKDSASFELGRIIQNGRILEKSKVLLDKKLLNQHIFISGVTGAGKTTTCQQILLQSKLPFLVIEPAKTEYRGLYELDEDIQFYTLNNEQLSPFRINPFELLPNEQLVGHIDTLKATFAAVFPMEASMPYLIEEAIVRSYESKGWDIHTSKNFLFENPFNCQGQAFPIMSEMLEQLKIVIKSKGFGDDLQQKYEGSLISRLDNLTIGSKGRMLNTRVSIDVSKLLDQKVVIELDELKDEQDKALMMGLLIGRVAEAMKQRHYSDPTFQHLTLIEEAHRLLEKPQGHDDGAKKLGVSLFANLLAEVRKYGEGLIIADQIPNKLAPEVLKNTNTKIIHRLFAADDRQAIGETVGLTEEQIDFLPMLKAGEAVVYSAGWHEAVRTQVGQLHNTNSKPLDIQIIASHSQRRIFSQRTQLYPRLSSVFDSEITAEQFNQFIQEGSFVLNLWLKWYALSQNEVQGHKLIITQRLSKEMEKLNQVWGDSKSDIKLALAQLFLDIAPIAYIEDKLPTKYPVEQYLIFLFGLYEHDQLNEKITSDTIFGQDTGRLIAGALQAMLQKLNSI